MSGTSPDRFSLKETIQYFQGLVSNLVRKTEISLGDERMSQLGGYQLRFLQWNSFRTMTNPSQEYSKVEPTTEKPLLIKREIWKEKCDGDILKTDESEQYFDVLARTTVLMAGAVFGVILLYLCCELLPLLVICRYTR